MKSIIPPLALVASTVLFAGIALPNEGDAPTYSLRSARKVGHIDDVNIGLEMTGNLVVKKGLREDILDKPPTSVTYERQYNEKTLEIPTGNSGAWRGVRYYRETAAVRTWGQVTEKPVLRFDRRLIVMEIVPFKATAFCPRGPLNGDEIELLATTGESLSLDELLPQSAVSITQKWKVADGASAHLLGLEEVTANSVEATLTEATPALARMELSGRIEGKRYGTMNRIDLRAKCRFDRGTQRIDWLAMRIKYSRDIGSIEAGLEATALVQIRILPKETSDLLSDEALKDLPLKPTDVVCRVEYEPADGGWRMLHDRSWFSVEHAKNSDVFLRLERGQDIAVCKIAPMLRPDGAKPVSLSQFQADVEKTLGKNLGEVLEAGESNNSAKYRVLRVVAKGTDGDVPVRWHYYLVSDDEGRKAGLTFRMEEKNVETFGSADKLLVQSLRFLKESPKEEKGKPKE